MTALQAVEQLQARLGGALSAPVEFRGEVSLTVDRAKLHESCAFLQSACAFDMLTDLSGVDNFGEDPRFEVDYLLYSFTHRIYLRLKVALAEDELVVDSVVDLWKTADWHEREAFDMFGIRFRNHPNLKRILMWDGYPYFPLRKDFPLAGLPTELPATAVDAGAVETSPMLGGPFAASSGTQSSVRREPRQSDTPAERIERLHNPTKAEPV